MPQPWDRRRVVYRRPIGPVAVRRTDEAPEDYVRRREEDERRLRDADREAYERGRQDARKSRRSHPILTFVVLALAALGLVFVGLWVRSGSPSQAGAQIGTAAAVAADRTQDAAVVATERGREAVGSAGRSLQTLDDEQPQGPGAATPATPALADSPRTAGETSTATTTTTTRQ